VRIPAEIKRRFGMRRPDFTAEDALLKAHKEGGASVPDQADALMRGIIRSHRRANRAPLFWLAIAGWAAIAGAIAINSMAFNLLFSVNYIGWFIENGALISISVGAIAAVLDLDWDEELVAAFPLNYFAALLLVLTRVAFAWGTVFAPPEPISTRYRSVVLDLVFANLALVAFVSAVAIYVIVVAPLQYFVNLIAGAPARAARGSGLRPVVRRSANASGGTTIHLEEVDRNAALPADGTEFGFGVKPVTSTVAISAALLLAVSQFV
jgi:hypothetical protein